MRSHISLKSNTYTEDFYVDMADINETAILHYPGRSLILLIAIIIER